VELVQLLQTLERGPLFFVSVLDGILPGWAYPAALFSAEVLVYVHPDSFTNKIVGIVG
jgi:hypothetical protein